MSRLPLRVRLTSSNQPWGGRSQEEEEPCPQDGSTLSAVGTDLKAWVEQPWLQSCMCLGCPELWALVEQGHPSPVVPVVGTAPSILCLEASCG